MSTTEGSRDPFESTLQYYKSITPRIREKDGAAHTFERDSIRLHFALSLECPSFPSVSCIFAFISTSGTHQFACCLSPNPTTHLQHPESRIDSTSLCRVEPYNLGAGCRVSDNEVSIRSIVSPRIALTCVATDDRLKSMTG